MINLDNFDKMIGRYGCDPPFDHCIIDNFFDEEFANSIEKEFPDYDDSDWFIYNNELEIKKTQNNWRKFPANTYQAFSYLMSPEIISRLSKLIGEELFVDHGLHGGGWHIHANGGNLNPHLDYSIHPKLGLERVLNLIVYISSGINNENGGHLGLWSHDEKNRKPGLLTKEIAPKFNRAVIFNTTQNSWHGMSNFLNLDPGLYRKSIAVYYLRRPIPGADTRSRALFAPREDQIGNMDVLETIRLRSDVLTSNLVYRK